MPAEVLGTKAISSRSAPINRAAVSRVASTRCDQSFQLMAPSLTASSHHFRTAAPVGAGNGDTAA